MKKHIIIIGILLVLTTLGFKTSWAWGFFAHKEINKIAVFTLPQDNSLFEFYKININYIYEHAVDPDKRRYANKYEAARHYIDMDRYGNNPFDSLPRNWYKAAAKYSEDTLNAHGIVPWHLSIILNQLTESFKEENLDKILHYSADLGHYVGDAHVPLHTTRNYNGQLTHQHGIHGFWESRLPELFHDNYDFFVGKAKYLKKPEDIIWKTIEESFAAKDSVLDFEKKLHHNFPQDKKYSFESRGATTMKVYSENYSKQYETLLNGMVERRMRKAIIVTGSFWYTAWVNAGKPNLSRLYNVSLSEQRKKEIAEEDKMWQTGKIYGRGCE